MSMEVCLTRTFQLTKGMSMKKTHGMTKTRTYRKWSGMKTRCYNKNELCFKYYGGKGIYVCDRWLNSFENFLDDMGEAPEGLTLDRINPDGNYEPKNCRWATIKQQASNKTNNKVMTYKGESKTLSEWSRVTGIGHPTILHRLKRGWNIEQSLGFKAKAKTQPNRWRYIEYNGVRKSLKQWCLETGIKRTTLLMRIDTYGWSIEAALGFNKI